MNTSKYTILPKRLRKLRLDSSHSFHTLAKVCKQRSNAHLWACEVGNKLMSINLIELVVYYVYPGDEVTQAYVMAELIEARNLDLLHLKIATLSELLDNINTRDEELSETTLRVLVDILINAITKYNGSVYDGDNVTPWEG